MENAKTNYKSYNEMVSIMKRQFMEQFKLLMVLIVLGTF